MNNSKKGFASMPIEQRREIARKGGLAVSKNIEHMRKIGQKGGQNSKRKKQKLA